MEHTVAHEEHGGGGKKEIIRVTIILSVLTIVELIIGFWMIGMESEGLRHFCKGAIIILMMAKAFYIVAYFMHLKHELKNMIMTIVVPLALFIWFIIAFLYDGNSFRHLRNTYDPHFKEQSTIKVEKKEAAHHGEEAKPAEKKAEEKGSHH
ncbi:cytochrome C oxidase subunit IV family protein [Sediminibacterium ginsengisoli]|uniref:Cytochrome c oxidase subunit IV n=1 Tax=Sediminibacterium ginsengisoli TaxID=413434 RepID=A0A1T4M132_9BACT|nr:cytochrome C oxidase subunit IV family protein [Sediminibacterium ginsengisoli]SJZ60632.1 Cytochrome c oxidase subunit IV [Sediminibacterium ginsengisoli]